MPLGVATSVNGVPIRLTAERWEHIIERHEILTDREEEVLAVIEHPDVVYAGTEGELRAARRDNSVYLMVVYNEVSESRRLHHHRLPHEEARAEAGGMEKLKLDDDQPLSWSYDEEADVLYISFGDPRPSLAIDMGDVLVLEADGEMTGITIVGARRMLDRKRSPAAAPAPK